MAVRRGDLCGTSTETSTHQAREADRVWLPSEESRVAESAPCHVGAIEDSADADVGRSEVHSVVDMVRSMTRIARSNQGKDRSRGTRFEGPEKTNGTLRSET